MKPFQQWSIRTKLMLLVFVVSVCIIIPISGGRLIWDYQQSKASLLGEITTLARLAADRSSAALIFDDARLAEENLDAMSGMPHIHKGCIYLADGSLFAEHTKHTSRCEWDFNRIEGSQVKTNQVNEGSWFTRQNLHVILPIQQGNSVQGYIYLVSDLTSVHTRMRQQITFSAFALFAVLLITGLITGWIRKLIAGPIESMLVKYRGLFDYANDVILLCDASTGAIMDINPVASSMYGYSRSELLSLNVGDLCTPETLAEIPDIMRRVRDEGEAVYERLQRNKEGGTIPVEVSSRLVEVDGKKAILSIIRNLTERKKVEKALKESEIRFRALVEQSPISTQIFSPDGTTILVNPAWKKFWGLNKDALENYNIFNDQQLIDNGIMPYIQMGFEGHAVEIPAIPYNPSDTPDIENATSIPDRWVRGFIFPIKDGDGNISEIIITHEDVTDKKYTEEAIKNIAAGVSTKTGSEFFKQLVLYLSKLFKTKYAFIGVLDEDNAHQVSTLAVSMNEQFIENITYDLVDTPCEQVIGHETCAYIQDVQKRFPKDLLLQKMDAESYIGTPLFDTYGNELGLIVLIDDKPLERIELVREILQIFATRAGAELERINAEKELTIKDRAMDVAIEGIMLTDARQGNKIIYANHALELITGYKANELVGQNPAILHGRKTDTATVMKLGQAINNEEACKVEMINYRKDRSEFWNEITLTPIKDRITNQVTHFIGTSVDITERRNTEEALRRSQKMEAVGQLAGGVAHDFNNQLGIIVGYLDFLNEYVEGKTKPSQWVETAMTATNRCIDLTRQLLVFSRRKINETVPTDINTELGKMDQLIAKSVTPAINVETHFGDHIWLVNIDPGELQDVILNLVINARDAMPGGGKLIIESANKSLDEEVQKISPDLKAGDYVQLTVRDTGSGIDEETLEHIFDPFFTTKPEGKGTGLGLSMVYGFAQRYDGGIKVDSEVGTGTTFKIYLPRAIESEEVKTADSTDKVNLPHGKEKILVVDDEPDLLELAAQYLDSLGYSVIKANSGETALQHFRDHPEIDGLFSDVVMPGGISGLELAEQITSFKPNIKVLLTSGFTDKVVSDDQHRFVQNLLHKPYRKAELAQRIREVFDSNNSPDSELSGIRNPYANTVLNNSTTTQSTTKALPFLDRTILVIDDDRDVRDLYKMNLTRLGCTTVCTRNGDEALAIIRETANSDASIDAIIIDLDIPGSLDGQELAEIIHEIYPQARLIVSSGDSGGDIMSRFAEYGFEAALEKNFNRDEIEQVLAKVLKTGS